MFFSECIDCGRDFPQKYEWQTRCYHCFKDFKKRREEITWGDPFGNERNNFSVVGDTRSDSNARDAEWLRANIKSLLHLCHPDKHGGSEQSNAMTIELLKIFKRAKS